MSSHFSIPLVYSLIAGIMAMGLFYLSYRDRGMKKIFYIFSLVFLIASWSGLEWAYWLMGHNMFDIILAPAVPLDFFFAVWIGFSIWWGEKIGERKVWIGFLVALAIIFAIARVCMNCVVF